jgi:hypothetical protein
MDLNSLVNWHSQHFNESTKQIFLQSIQSSTPDASCTSTAVDSVSVDLSREIIEMFRFSEEYKRQRKLEKEEEVQEEIVKVQSAIEKFGEKGREIQELEQELEEKGKEFVDFHVWPVLPLKF